MVNTKYAIPLLAIVLVLAGCTQAGCVGNCQGEPVECKHGREWECENNHCSYECNLIPQPQENATQEAVEISFISFSVDKSECGSLERVQFFLALESSSDAKANVTVKGIRPFSRFYINKRVEVELNRGINELTINATTPSCTSGCGGVKPGEYKMTAEVLVNGTALDNMNTTLALHR